MVSEKIGLRMNKTKTKLMKVHTRKRIAFLGDTSQSRMFNLVINKDGGADTDIKNSFCNA